LNFFFNSASASDLSYLDRSIHAFVIDDVIYGTYHYVHFWLIWFILKHYQDILNNVIFVFKMSLLSESHLMTVVINMHKPYFIFKT